MDSLMGLELRMSIAEEFGIELSPMALSQDVSIQRVAEMLCDEELGRSPAAGEAKVAPVTEGSVEEIVEAERASLISLHNETVDTGLIEEAVRELAEVPPTQRGRLIQ